MEDMEELENSRLFKGIARENIAIMLKCLGARKVSLKKGESILKAGDEVRYVGIVLAGTVNIIKEDIDGERALLTRLGSGDNFAEALCSAGIRYSPVNVIAESDTMILLLDFQRVLGVCANVCAFHQDLIKNMLGLIAHKNLQLQERMEYLGKKTIRKRVLEYLARQSAGSAKVFKIPFNREELADYLCVDRSALSRELMQLKKEKVIDCWKNTFRLMKD